jgi:NitT/TauT family transport system ATP-binding protein
MFFQKRQEGGMKPGLTVITSSQAVGCTKQPVLEIKSLGRIFRVNGSFLTVLQDIEFAVQAGEMICILGPSGCGKTTLLKILAGFVKPSQGAVLLRGSPVTRPGPDRCVVFQEDALFPWLTVEENIAFGLKGKKTTRAERRRQVDRYLSLVGLEAFGRYLPGEISGGMKQRVSLARVLILEPDILLMDEPFAALDAQTREDMQQLLLGLWGMLSHTIVFVTHDVREAVNLADRVIVMNKNPGRIKEIVAVDLDRPRNIDDAKFHARCATLHHLLRRQKSAP